MAAITRRCRRRRWSSRQGRISWVGPGSRSQGAGRRGDVTDLNGAFVIPGLIDLHAHIGNTVDLVQDSKFHTRESIEKDLKTYASYGVTTVLSMGTDQDAIFPVRNEQRAAFASAASARRRTRRQPVDGACLHRRSGPDVQGRLRRAGRREQSGRDARAGGRRGQRPAGQGRRRHQALARLRAGDDAEDADGDCEGDHRRRAQAQCARAGACLLSGGRQVPRRPGHRRLRAQVRDQPIDQALIDSMEKHGTWQVAATLSREASMFAYGSTPAFASDPFFTRGVSAKTLELIKSPERQKTIASGSELQEVPAVLRDREGQLQAAR